MACTNLAGLLIARGSARRREIAVRVALGGSRLRVVRSLLTEALVLAVLGGALGMLVTLATIRTMDSIWPAAFQQGDWNLAFVDANSFALDMMTLVYTMGLGLLAGLLFGVGPALRLSGADVSQVLKQAAGAAANGRRWKISGRPLLVAAQVAVALVLLVGAGLMLGSLINLLSVETGFDAERVLVVEYALPSDGVPAADAAGFHRAFLERIRALPPVIEAGGGLAPLRGHWNITRLVRATDTTWDADGAPRIGVHTITDGYFEALDVPIVSGRGFTAADGAGGPTAMIINETAARQYFGDIDPIGRPLAVAYGPTSDGTPAEVVGVVADVLFDTPVNGMMPEAFFHQRQNPEGDTEVLIKTRAEPTAVLADVRAAMAALDPDIPIYNVTTVADIAAEQTSDTRVIVRLLGVFAAVALLLAITGIWGVVGYGVAARRREIGIRMALGARAIQSVRLVVRQGIASIVAGMVVGTAGALAASRYLSSLLFEMSAFDPTAFAAAALLLAAIALLAAWLPARRAARIDPMIALRSE